MVVMIGTSLCSETDLSFILTIVAICGNLLGEACSNFSVAIDHMERSGKQPLTAA